MTLNTEKSRLSRVREIERFLDVISRKEKAEQGFDYTWTNAIETESAESDEKKEILRLGSEVQELRNQVNKYWKVEAREESINQFKQMISQVKEVKQVSVNHKIDEVNFLISYDNGNRTDIIEKIVEIQICLEDIFNNLKFDFHLFPAKSSAQALSSGELIYSRRD